MTGTDSHFWIGTSTLVWKVINKIKVKALFSENVHKFSQRSIQTKWAWSGSGASGRVSVFFVSRLGLNPLDSNQMVMAIFSCWDSGFF